MTSHENRIRQLELAEAQACKLLQTASLTDLERKRLSEEATRISLKIEELRKSA